jgi:hypothetical protein
MLLLLLLLLPPPPPLLCETLYPLPPAATAATMARRQHVLAARERALQLLLTGRRTRKGRGQAVSLVQV